MHTRLNRVLLLFSFLLFTLCSVAQVAPDGDRLDNRFQYPNYQWNYLKSDKFSVYFPVGYDSLVAYVAHHYDEVETELRLRMPGFRIKFPSIIIYPSIDKLYESNIGVFSTDRLTVPAVVFKGERMVLFYNGSYEHLRGQMFEAFARSVWERGLQESATEQAKGAVVQKDIPYWFKEGAIQYLAFQWPLLKEDELRRLWMVQEPQAWEGVIETNQKLSGQAFCYFLSESFDELAVPHLYHHLKTKSFARALRLVTKTPQDSLFAQCYRFYDERFAHSVLPRTDMPALMSIASKKGKISNITVSDDYRYVSYLSARGNVRSVFVYDTLTHKTRRISKYVQPVTLANNVDIYPLTKWRGSVLQVMMPKKGKLTLTENHMSAVRKDSYLPEGADGVRYWEESDSNELLLSAFRKGQSDIVAYHRLRGTYIPYTNDGYDDGRFTMTKSGQLCFVSYRPDSSANDTLLKQGLFMRKPNYIVPLVTGEAKYMLWDKPTAISGNRLLATHTEFGAERFAVLNNEWDSLYTTKGLYRPYQYLADKDEMVFSEVRGNKIIVASKKLDDWLNSDTMKPDSEPWLHDYWRREELRKSRDSIRNLHSKTPPSLLDDILKPNRNDSSHNPSGTSFIPSDIRRYRLQLYKAYFTGKVNNDYFINRYQPYQSYLGQFKFPELSGMLQGGVADLFENHRLNVSFRLPASANGSDFLARYENAAKNTDWGLMYSRKVEQLKPEQGRVWSDEAGRPYPQMAKVKSHYYEIFLHRPISYRFSANFSQAIRNDRTIFQASDKYSLNYEDIKSVWSISSLTLSYYRLTPTLSFLAKGFKIKLHEDVFKGFSRDKALALGTTVHAEGHLPLYRYITLVASAQLGRSGGDSRILYNFGGLDNNVTTRVDTSVHFNQSAPYAFQTLVTPLRGYYQNSIYGDRYALVNADVYFPLFQTLVPIETSLQSINMLQPGIFADAVTVREMWNPLAAANGWKWSYGLSARTNLAGYTIRFDIAWPGSFAKKPVWYLSLKI